MFTGTRAYKRAVRSYKLMYEAIFQLLLKEFELAYPVTAKEMKTYLEQLKDESNFNTMASSETLVKYCNDLVEFKDKIGQQNDLTTFWLSFLDITETLLNLIYATRSGDWNLYVETIKSTLPWFFAYDRTNYSRYLTVHHQDLLSLKKDFPEIHAEFEKGNFSIQISEKNPFGRSEADKVIETTINRDTKTPGGTTGKKPLI